MKENIERINEKIEAACDRAGRSYGDVRLMAVSKTRTWDEIMTAYGLGMRLFGENRLQEIQEKFVSPPEDMELHLIGHLQSNKAKIAVGHTSCIHSIDKIKTAAAVEKQCLNLDRDVKILLEVNTSGEDSKNGFRDEKCVFDAVEEILKFERVKIAGFMTMAPFVDDETVIRGTFRKLKELQAQAEVRFPEADFSTLSMGMSSDYEIAVEEGANILRIGTILFGARDYT